MKSLPALFLFLFPLSVFAAEIDCPTVLVRGMDKITGRTTTAELTIGQSAMVGGLRITAQRCLKNPPEEMPEDAAFLLIEEKNRTGGTDTVFNGWMFSSNPALSAMEHPIYDIWVLSCQPPEVASDTWIKSPAPVLLSPTSDSHRVQVEDLSALDSDDEDLTVLD